MGLQTPSKLASVDLNCTDSGTDNVKRPFYIMDVDVKHNIGLTPVYYIGGSWPTYNRQVFFQPQSGGGTISLTGFFGADTSTGKSALDNYEETYEYLTNSATVLSPSSDLDLRINGKKYTKCFCAHHSLRSQSMGGVNVIFGTITYLFSSVEDYP